MKYSQIINALKCINSVLQLRLPYPKARDIFKLSKRLTEENDFFGAEEIKLVREYAKKDQNGDPVVNGGVITFPDIQNKQKYTVEIQKLLDMETDHIEPVTLTADDIGDQTIQPDVIAKLDGIVIFE